MSLTRISIALLLLVFTIQPLCAEHRRDRLDAGIRSRLNVAVAALEVIAFEKEIDHQIGLYCQGIGKKSKKVAREIRYEGQLPKGMAAESAFAALRAALEDAGWKHRMDESPLRDILVSEDKNGRLQLAIRKDGGGVLLEGRTACYKPSIDR